MARKRRHPRTPPITPPVVTVAGRLAAAQATRDAADAEILTAVAEGRALGMTWELLGAAVGITRQAARQRWGRG